jgi:hypothetical protein
MASLAILVSAIFIVVLLIGPISYLLTKIMNLPSWAIYLLAIANIGIGLWWFLLPIPNIRFIGLIDIVIGWKLCVVGDKKNKT